MLSNKQMDALIFRAMAQGATPENNFDNYFDFLIMQTDLNDKSDGLDELLAERPELAWDINKTYVVDHGCAL